MVNSQKTNQNLLKTAYDLVERAIKEGEDFVNELRAKSIASKRQESAVYSTLFDILLNAAQNAEYEDGKAFRNKIAKGYIRDTTDDDFNNKLDDFVEDKLLPEFGKLLYQKNQTDRQKEEEELYQALNICETFRTQGLYAPSEKYLAVVRSKIKNYYKRYHELPGAIVTKYLETLTIFGKQLETDDIFSRASMAELFAALNKRGTPIYEGLRVYILSESETDKWATAPVMKDFCELFLLWSERRTEKETAIKKYIEELQRLNQAIQDKIELSEDYFLDGYKFYWRLELLYLSAAYPDLQSKFQQQIDDFHTWHLKAKDNALAYFLFNRITELNARYTPLFPQNIEAPEETPEAPLSFEKLRPLSGMLQFLEKEIEYYPVSIIAARFLVACPAADDERFYGLIWLGMEKLVLADLEKALAFTPLVKDDETFIDLSFLQIALLCKVCPKDTRPEREEKITSILRKLKREYREKMNPFQAACFTHFDDFLSERRKAETARDKSSVKQKETNDRWKVFNQKFQEALKATPPESILQYALAYYAKGLPAEAEVK